MRRLVSTLALILLAGAVYAGPPELPDSCNPGMPCFDMWLSLMRTYRSMDDAPPVRLDDGNRFRIHRDFDGVVVEGYNLRTGRRWETKYGRDWSVGTDSRGHFWRYNQRTGYYWNEDGILCLGVGTLRRCY